MPYRFPVPTDSPASGAVAPALPNPSPVKTAAAASPATPSSLRRQPHHPATPHHHHQNVTLTSDPASDGGLLPLEPPLSSSDYSFTLDDGENLNDLFDLF